MRENTRLATRGVSRSNSFRAERVKRSSNSATSRSPSTGTETGFYLSQGLAGFAAPLLCESAVVEVFPQLAVRPEIDHDGGLLTGFIHEETDSGNHRPTSRTCIPAANAAREIVLGLHFGQATASLAALHRGHDGILDEVRDLCQRETRLKAGNLPVLRGSGSRGTVTGGHARILADPQRT